MSSNNQVETMQGIEKDTQPKQGTLAALKVNANNAGNRPSPNLGNSTPNGSTTQKLDEVPGHLSDPNGQAMQLLRRIADSLAKTSTQKSRSESSPKNSNDMISEEFKNSLSQSSVLLNCQANSCDSMSEKARLQAMNFQKLISRGNNPADSIDVDNDDIQKSDNDENDNANINSKRKSREIDDTNKNSKKKISKRRKRRKSHKYSKKLFKD